MTNKKRWQKLAGMLNEQVESLDLAKIRKKAEWIKGAPNTPRSWNQVLFDIKEMLDGGEGDLRQGVYGDWSDRELEALLGELGPERDPGSHDTDEVASELRSMVSKAYEGKAIRKSELMEMIRETVSRILDEGSVADLASFRKEKRDREEYFNTVLVSTDGRFIFNPDDYLFVELDHRDQADALADADVDLAIELGAKVTTINDKVRQNQPDFDNAS